MYDSLEREISKAVLSWENFSEFRTILHGLGGELWLDFRPRIIRLGELIDKWRGKVRNFPRKISGIFEFSEGFSLTLRNLHLFLDMRNFVIIHFSGSVFLHG